MKTIGWFLFIGIFGFLNNSSFSKELTQSKSYCKPLYLNPNFCQFDVFDNINIQYKSNKQSQNYYVTSDSMTLPQIEQSLKFFPPNFENGEQRLQIMESLDKIIDFCVRDNDRDEKKLEEIITFYRRQIDEGLQALEQTDVYEGVHIFKFYSSSLILKSPAGTIAIDFCQGPVGNDYKLESYSNEGEPETSDYFKTNFYLTTEQRDKLANLVDVYLITHPHQDHADYSLAKRMIQAGKTVVGPEQLKLKWEDLSPNIIVPNYYEIQKIGPCEILTQPGFQYKKSKKVANGDLYGVPTRYFSHDVESVRYLIRMNGITFLQSAESQTDAYMWLEMAQDINWNVDVLISAGMLQGGRSVMKFLENNSVEYFSLPVHEYEITHSNGGQRAANRLKGDNWIAFENKMLMPLMWGENFLLTENLLNRDFESGKK